MALYKRGNVWWVSFTHGKQRVQQTTGTSDRLAAQQYYDKLKADRWSIKNLDTKPDYSWQDAVSRWLNENQHKKSIEDDKMHLRWLHKHLQNAYLNEITRDWIERIAQAKEKEGVRPATINRMLEVVRAILRKAQNEWEWIDKIPHVRMYAEENHRIRWITPCEAKRLVTELPPHLSDMAAFSLATGLRASNVMGLLWNDIDLVRCHAWIHPDKAKSKKAIPVPLNTSAMAILQKRKGINKEYVFTYKDCPIGQCNTKAWRKALERAGIKNFRWHDLRHTWASWHVQNGTSLQELQQLGGWSNLEMVLRYAHLSSEHLKQAANRVSCYSGSKW